jgi:hypothetical protein
MGQSVQFKIASLGTKSTCFIVLHMLMGSQSHHEKHNNRQQNTTFSGILSRTCCLFSTTYTGSGLVRHSSSSLREWGTPGKCNGGGRSLQHKPNKYNGSLIPFSGVIAFHCVWKTLDHSNFAKIEHRTPIMAGQLRDHRDFGDFQGVGSRFWREIRSFLAAGRYSLSSGREPGVPCC